MNRKSNFHKFIDALRFPYGIMNIDPSIFLRVVPLFDGTSTELNRFIKNCDVMLESIDKDELPFYVKLIKTRLLGKAFDIINQKTLDSWIDLKAELITQFSDSRSLQFIQLQLLNAKQEKNECIRDFGNRIQGLYSDLISVCERQEGKDAAKALEKTYQKICLSAFEEGIASTEIKILIKASQFTTLLVAINKACDHERVSMERCTPVALNQLKNPVRSEIIKCQICFKNGHLADKCLQRYDTNRLNYATVPRTFLPNSTSSTFPCAYCKKPGHHITQCYRKQASDSRPQPSYLAIKNEPTSIKYVIPTNEIPTSTVQSEIDEQKNVSSLELESESPIRAQFLQQ